MGHNICFYAGVWKKIPKLFLKNLHLEYKSTFRQYIRASDKPIFCGDKVLRCMSTCSCFQPVLQRATTLTTSCLLPGTTYPYKMGSTLKRKNLLLQEQILSFKSVSLMEKGGKTENG